MSPPFHRVPLGINERINEAQSAQYAQPRWMVYSDYKLVRGHALPSTNHRKLIVKKYATSLTRIGDMTETMVMMTPPPMTTHMTIIMVVMYDNCLNRHLTGSAV